MTAKISKNLLQRSGTHSAKESAPKIWHTQCHDGPDGQRIKDHHARTLFKLRSNIKDLAHTVPDGPDGQRIKHHVTTCMHSNDKERHALMQTRASAAPWSNRGHVGTLLGETAAWRHPPFGLPCPESRTASASAPKGEQSASRLPRA